MKQTDCHLKEKNKKVNELMKVKFGGQIIKKFVGLRAKTYSYVKEQRRRQKKKTKKCAINRELKFIDYNNYLRASQIENIMNYLEKKEIDMNCLKKEYIKNRPISKTQQRFKSERHNVFN